MSYEYLINKSNGTNRDGKFLDHVLNAVEMYAQQNKKFKVKKVNNKNDRNELEQVLKVYVLSMYHNSIKNKQGE
ncbi:MAG: hypothetical protein WC860_07020 [Candidatus Margulisiibacteriota bacterium]|jgi:hypothetical protein